MRSLALAIVVTAMACSSFAQNVGAQQSVRRIIQNEILSLLPADGAGGIAIAVHIDGRLMFFDEGFADLAERRPITPDSLFNVASLRKPFEASTVRSWRHGGYLVTAAQRTAPRNQPPAWPFYRQWFTRRLSWFASSPWP